jgi:hypothetical protein
MLDLINNRIEIINLMNNFNFDFTPEFEKSKLKVENNEIDTADVKFYNSQYDEVIFKLIELK